MTECFILTGDHIALVSHMNVDWDDSCYDGAPKIDIKRPYGSRSAWESVAKIIGIMSEEDDDGEARWPKGMREKCLVLHQETLLALQVCLSTRSFIPGEYVRKRYTNKWHRVGNGK